MPDNNDKKKVPEKIFRQIVIGAIAENLPAETSFSVAIAAADEVMRIINELEISEQ